MTKLFLPTAVRACLFLSHASPVQTPASHCGEAGDAMVIDLLTQQIQLLAFLSVSTSFGHKEKKVRMGSELSSLKMGTLHLYTGLFPENVFNHLAHFLRNNVYNGGYL